MAVATTNDTNKRAKLTVTATATSTGISWAAAVADNNANFGGYAAAAGSWTIKIGSTTVATASGKSYDFGSGVISSPYFPRADSNTLALSPGTYRVTGTFSGDGTTVGTATITAFDVVVAASTFTVTYSNANGANGTTTETVTSGSKGTFPSPGSRTGYTFDGWYDSATGSYYSSGTSTPTITAAKTFTSSWTTASYSISYAANGGSGTMNNTTWSYPNSGTVASNSFTRTGYTFSGWTNSSTGAAVAVGATFSTSVALTANWTGNTGTVYYNGNGNDGGSTANTTWTYPATSGTVRANGFTRSGYTFARWNTAANGSGTDYYPGGTTPADGTTLYAIWGILAVYPSFTDTTVLTPATMGKAYSDAIGATNASSYSIISGSIPTGLSFNTSTGAITGTPTAQGEFTFSARATSTTSNTADSGNITIVVYPPGKRPDTNTRLTTAKRFTGSAWVNLTVMKRFDGSNWVNITNT